MAGADSAFGRHSGTDPARILTIGALWVLLAVFVLYPLGSLLGRALTDDNGFTLAPLIAAVYSKSNLRAFGNSLLLATLVGICGTLLGFLFAFAVERTRLSRFSSKL